MDRETIEYSQEVKGETATTDEIDLPINVLVALVVITIFLLSALLIYCVFGCETNIDLDSTPPTQLKEQE